MADPPTTEKKDGATKAEPGEQINIKVRDAEGNEVQFKIKRTTMLKKLMDAYCSRMGTSAGSYRFLFDGHRINDDDTPESLDMQELDCVDAMVTQLGGDSADDFAFDADIDAGLIEDDENAVIDGLWFLKAVAMKSS